MSEREWITCLVAGARSAHLWLDDNHKRIAIKHGINISGVLFTPRKVGDRT